MLESRELRHKQVEKKLGVEAYREMLRRTTLNQACFRCGRHHGIECVCTLGELRAHANR